ncbi:MAG: response regulator [Treponema sp.]|jgi:signal transduction histidine kinase/DNA-binding response OmpR family regulator/HPt (histidine-containing phosphotransfer) domain-containing protein|nr:response regulator [Treponema sp.]
MRYRFFSAKTFIFITLGVILALNVVQALSFFLNVRSLAYNQILGNTTENTLALTDSISRQFRAWNSLADDTAVGVIPFLAGDEKDFAAVKKYLIAMAENKDDIASLQVASTVSRNAPGGYFVANNFDAGDIPADSIYNDHITWDYLIQAMESPGTHTYYGPYFDLITGELMISLGYIVQDYNGEDTNFLGCVMIDILLDRLIDTINRDTTIEYRDTFLINKTGEFISDKDLVHQEELDIAYAVPKDFFVEKNLEAYREAVLGGDTFSHLDKDVFIHSAYIPAADWILVSTIPAKTIFADANVRILRNSITCAVIIIVNIGLGLIILYIIRKERAKLVKMKDTAEAASRSKSDFLARMSHEIRTPLNAIIGMSELALQEEAGPVLPEYLANIRQAGSNLLSIINDVLDISKIESGGIQLAAVSYRFSSLINNVINVIRVRFHEKPILFLATIDAHIPNSLMGDEVRIRQILLNMLSNAVKYTEEGFIKFTVTGTVMDAGTITLKFEVADTGIGIKEEDMKELFGNFTRLDLQHNQAIEGTGLGLAITRRLCREMGGDITVSSVYGKGSVFTALILQEYTADAETAIVERPGEKEVLLYDERPLYGDSVSATLENLGVPVTRLNSGEDFLAALGTGRFSFAFVSPLFVKQASDLIEDKKIPTTLALLANLEEIASFHGIPVLLMPAYAVPVANLLNGVRIARDGRRSLVRFTAPEVRVLIVDDIMTNLKVAQGLLSAYRMQVDICDNGRSSISKIKDKRYDLVFMDHMMPGMDGIEALAHIRALEGEYFKQVPIIALTANALSGMEEMFLSRGFNDYLAKPIEISKLNALMEKWIPIEKRQPVGSRGAVPESIRSTVFEIEGLDVERGLVMAGGTEAAYREILNLYCRDVEERMAFLARPPGPEDMESFIIHVHALKSVSAGIGAEALSAQALLLEKAGLANNMDLIAEHLPDFGQNLSRLVAQIGAVLRAKEKSEEESAQDRLPLDRGSLLQLRAALDQLETSKVDLLLQDMLSGVCPDHEKQILSKISTCVLFSEFEEAIALLDGLLDAGNSPTPS